jgi:hypothetical protein
MNRLPDLERVMLTVAKGANAALMFFLELSLYLLVGRYWGFTLSERSSETGLRTIVWNPL